MSSQPTKHTHAAADNIIINELMYHAGSDLDTDDYIELYNPTGSPIDISGWCFSAGITGCFANGTTVAAGQYIVAAKNIAQAQTTYSITASLEYAGNLSNSGETVTLINTSAEVVDTVTYSDQAPWPASPDGTGPSLELKDPNLDNTLSTSWGGSLNNGGTPAAENSLTNSNLPTITIETKPTGVTANTITHVTAQVEGNATVELVYKVNFDNEQTVTMYDDGTHNDGAASDGLYGADIPGQLAGKLVRYRVTATNIGGTSTAPSNDDSQDYYGYVVVDPSQVGSTPILQWFISDTNYTSLQAENVLNEVYYPCVIAYGDQVFDNSQIRLKGEYSSTFDKKPYKVKLPTGYYIEMPNVLTTALNEFHLNSDFPNNQYVASLVSWRAFERAGFDMPQMEKVQLQRNGNFEGAYTLAEKYDKEWRARRPFFNTGILYEDYFERKYPSGDDHSDIESWRTNMSQAYSETKQQYVRDNNNLANIVNFMATAAILRHHDWTAESNVFEHLDTADTGRWSVYPWDLDLTLQDLIANNNPATGKGDMIDPNEVVSSLNAENRFFATAIWEDPELRAMYQRRIRTLVEKIYGNGWIQSQVDTEYAKAQTAAELDYTKWYDYEFATHTQPILDILTGLGYDYNDPVIIEGYTENSTGLQMEDFPDPITAIAPLTPANRLFALKNQLSQRKELFLGDYVQRGLIPAAQPDNTKVFINEIGYNPAGGTQHQYIELYNPNNYAVDISGWQIPEIGLAFPQGSAVAANKYVLAVKDDPAFRTGYSGRLILTEFSSELPNQSITLHLRNSNGAIADTVDETITQSDSGSISRLASQTGNDFESTSPTPGLPNPQQCADIDSCSQSSIMSSEFIDSIKPGGSNFRTYLLVFIGITLALTTASIAIVKLKK